MVLGDKSRESRSKETLGQTRSFDGTRTVVCQKVVTDCAPSDKLLGSASIL